MSPRTTAGRARERAAGCVAVMLAALAAFPAVLPAAENISPLDRKQDAPQTAGQPSVPAAAPAPAQPAADAAAGVIRAGETLSLERCIAIALENHPAVIAGGHTVRAYESRVGQAQSGYYPQLALATGYNRYSLISDPANAIHDQYSTSATLTQNLFEFGRTWNQVTVQQRNRDAVRGDLRAATNQVVLNVRSAYFDVLQAGKSVEVLADSVRSFEQHLDQARAFFEAGVRSKFDVTKAEVDLSNARLLLIRAQNTLKTARAVLNNTMGMPDAPDYAVEDTLSFVKYTISYEEAVGRAYANRPDLHAQAARTEAADASLSLARKGFFPTLSGSANYQWQDANEDPISPSHYPFERSGWTAGITLTFPLFSGFLTSYQVGEAKENLGIAKANEENLRQEVLLDVQKAYLNLGEAEERVGVAELSVRQAEESYEIARGRYEAGVGSIIEETDALVALRNARLGLISAQADYKVAEAALKRAMGEQ